jgi:predicted DNA-binding transcriptional regulator AlpA
MTASSQRQQADPLLTIPQLASMAGLHASTLYRSLERGDFPLPLIRLGSRVRVSRAAAERLIHGAPSPAPPAPVAAVAKSTESPPYCAACGTRLKEPVTHSYVPPSGSE